MSPEGGTPIAVPDEVQVVPAALGGLDHAAPATDAPFLMEGPGFWLAGVGMRSGFRVGRDSHVLARIQPQGLGGVARTVSFPGLVRRQLVGARGSAVETLLVTPGLPLAAAQWERGSGPASLIVDFDSDPVPVAQGGSCFVVDRDGISLAIALVPGGEGARVSSGRLAFESVTEVGGPPTLLISVGTPDRIRAAFAAARHLTGHATRAAAGPDEGLLLETAVPEIDDGVRWLRARLGGRCAAQSAPPLTLGLAAIAVGEADESRRVIERLARHDEQAVLAARHAATFGDGGAASGVARAWIDTADRGPERGPLTGLAARLLSDAVDTSVHPELLGRLRALAATPAPAVGERRLPTVGSGTVPAAEADTAAWLGTLFTGNPEAPPTAARDDVRRARAAAARFGSDPDAAWLAWREMVARAPLWDLPVDLDPHAHTESLTAELLLALYHGLLGAAPDATVGRLRLAPRLPSHLTAFGATGIAIGSATLGLRYERDGPLVRFELSPEAARVPPVVIFEPAVSGEVHSTRVDGEAVTLDVRRSGGGAIVPVQLPVDATRVLEIEVG